MIGTSVIKELMKSAAWSPLVKILINKIIYHLLKLSILSFTILLRKMQHHIRPSKYCVMKSADRVAPSTVDCH